MPVGARGRPAAGYGITDDSDEPPPFDSMSDADKLWLALREEPIFGATNAEIAAFIEDSAREYGDYVTFVNKLRDDLGSRCVIYRGLTNAESEGLSDLLNEFSDTGLHVYGPTFDQLLACAGRLVGRSEDLIEDAFADSPGTLVEAYKNALQVLTEQDASDSADGAAVNCQSLVLRMGNDGRKVLLTGDMQFAQPDVGEASQAVKDLLATVNEDAPFDWVKLSHHGATNGQNKTILTKWGKRFTISTGSTSSKHPTEPTLKALEQIESTGVEWSRVDMNGRCTFAVEGTSARLKTQRGDLNDKTRPSARSGDEVPVPVEGPVLPRVQEPVRPQIVRGGASDETIEIIVRLPNRRTKFSFTCEVDPGGGDDRPFDGGAVVEAKSTRGIADRLRGLPRLLFVTDGAALARNIGRPATDAVLGAIAAANHRLVNQSQATLLAATRQVLKNDPSVKGVVLLGGYDVVRSQILNALPTEMAQVRVRDRDRLQVWNDDGYGDRDDDGVPELPVSRIPDARDAAFLTYVLSAPALSGRPTGRAGIRNIRRPFADSVFGLLPGASPLFTSEPTAPNLPPYSLAGDFLYLMLHGTASDTSTFTGEDLAGGYPVAVDVKSLPKPSPSVVFTGSCYGALIVDTLARDAAPGDTVRGRRVADSIALSCLAGGANAFVGCTGVHFSPTQRPLSYFGEPMHRAFVTHLLDGKPPSHALWAAKTEYANGIPHRLGARVEEIAYEHKILRQFTCLGLGW